jgi:hypothetical protein
MQSKRWIFLISVLLLLSTALAQPNALKKKWQLSGTMGISYEGYGLNRNPDGWTGFAPRKPWNQVRINFSPTMKFGSNWTIPFNINFATTPTNFAGPYSGISKPDFMQFITNPMNNFGINPTYKWAEFQLGTQYLNYSELSTGDVGIFGAGFDLKPGQYRIKFFSGISQRAVNFFTGAPTSGAFARQNWMMQVGKEREGKYSVAFNFVKARDQVLSLITPPPTVTPQEGFTTSLVTKLYFSKGWYFSAEGAHSFYTRDLNAPLTPTTNTFKPFLDGHSSTVRDYAGEGSVGKRSDKFDVGVKVKYLGAGFQTPGYPFLQPDRIDYTVNTRIQAWKRKMNIVANVGQRVNNVSNTTLRAKQLIANLNWFTQFNERWNLNVSYNNFGFQAPGGINPFGIKNVSNDLGINPSYTWSNSRMSHLLSLNYNYSKYDERDILTGLITSNNTHMILLTYVPTFFTRDLTPDFSALYFYNNFPGFKTTLITLSSGISFSAAKKKLRLRGQLQYTLGKNNNFRNNNNLIASSNADWKINERLTWTNYLGTNYYKYGNEITPAGANYLESNLRTGLQYRFGK